MLSSKQFFERYILPQSHISTLAENTYFRLKLYLYCMLQNQSLLQHFINLLFMEETDYRDRKFSLAEGISRKQAEKNMRSNLSNVETMKNRLKVLTLQAEYNQYRQKYQSSQIQRHHQIHEDLIKSKAEVKAILSTRDESLVKKQIKEKMNKQLKERLSSALEKMKKEKTDQYKELKEKSLQNVEFLAKRRLKELQIRRSKKEEVSRMEGQMKQAVSRYSQQKREQVKMIKQLQMRSMHEINQHINKQLEELNAKEKQLINLNSESFRSSRALDREYTNLFQRKGMAKSFKLPGIKKLQQGATTNTQ